MIEKNVVLGGQVGIGEHARIKKGVMLGGQGGVLPNKVLRGKGVAFWGTPARPVREYLKTAGGVGAAGKKELLVLGLWPTKIRRVRLPNNQQRMANDQRPRTNDQGPIPMALIVIGGHSRSVGKTSVVAGLISALPEYNWTALKITQYGHGVCSMNGEPCHCATDDHSWAISEERSLRKIRQLALSRRGRGPGMVGADRAGASGGGHARAAGKAGRIENAILESNSILEFLRPDLYLTVLDPATADFKKSAQEFLDRADAVILHETQAKTPAWRETSLKPVAQRPVFRISPPPYVTPQIIEFIRLKLTTEDTEDTEKT